MVFSTYSPPLLGIWFLPKNNISISPGILATRADPIYRRPVGPAPACPVGEPGREPLYLPSALGARPSERKGPGRSVASARHASPRPGRGPQGRPPARPYGEGFASACVRKGRPCGHRPEASEASPGAREEGCPQSGRGEFVRARRGPRPTRPSRAPS